MFEFVLKHAFDGPSACRHTNTVDEERGRSAHSKVAGVSNVTIYALLQAGVVSLEFLVQPKSFEVLLDDLPG
jgi:hypothetical protein